MCSISGFNWKDENKIVDMVGALSHRGPDANGIYLDENISLGHNRLSIIDLDQRSNQPMFSSDNTFVIVFNGEIYNFKELKKELSDHSFKTESDTEVILAGYKKWGKGVVEKLNGMFAFAIWDKTKNELFCARDHAGVKPLYYYWDGKKFIFASEVRAIFTHDIPRKLNKAAFDCYMRVLYAPEPMTMTENVYKLPPQSFLILKNNYLSIEKYGNNLPVKKTDLSYQDAKNILREKVFESVDRQMVSDVPLGLYLSGGIDSSTLLFSMSRFRKNIKTFSVGFDLREDEESDKFNKDFHLAARVADFFGADHHSLIISAKDARSVLEESVSQSGEPISHPTSVAMRLLAEYAKREVTVTLSGDGSDELFGGYDRYLTSRRADIIGSIPGLKYLLPSKVRKVVEGSALERFVKFEFEKDFRLAKVLSKDYFTHGLNIRKSFEKYFAGSNDKTESFMFADFSSWLPDYSFALSDAMSMASALEQRVPFVDKDLVEFSRSLPINYKVDFFQKKKILKDTFRKDLPEFLFAEPKRGWFSPGAKWLRDPDFTCFTKEILSRDYHAGTADLFDWEGVARTLEDHVYKREYNLTILWAILTFQIWAKYYKVEI